MKRIRYTAVLLLSLLTIGSAAKTQDSSFSRSWYVGLGAGVPFSVSSFSSIAPGGPYWGVGSNLSAGYRFNRLLSLEADFGLGLSNLAAQTGCIESNGYLASDGRLYYATLLGQECWSVKDFKSSVSYLNLGLSANFNLLSGLKQSRWRLELSPRIAAYSTKAALKPFSGGVALPVSQNKGNLHFGYGVALKASYRVSERISLGFRSSITSLTGKGFDGIPDHAHKTNFIWDNSLQFSYEFASRKSRKASHIADLESGQAQTAQAKRPGADAIYHKTCFNLTKPALPKAATIAGMEPRSPMPEGRSVYFDFDKWTLNVTQKKNLLEILEALKSDSSLRVSLEGWCDRYGSDEGNMIISRLRAESVKSWLVSQGIDSDRIEISGKGSDKTESNCAKARRVEVKLSRQPQVSA